MARRRQNSNFVSQKPAQEQALKPAPAPELIGKPVPVQRPTSPFEVVIGEARRVKASCLQETDANKAQLSIKQIDKILKDLADLQKAVGEVRNECGAHVQNLRQAKPKGKPAEGEVRMASDGTKLIFSKGRFYPISEDASPKEES
jgi:hypothetical protein